MFRNTRVQILVAVLFGLIAAILVWSYTQEMQSRVRVAQNAQAPTPTPIQKTDVLIAGVDVWAHTLVTADMVKVVQVPVELKLGTALTKPEDAIGRVAQYPIAVGEQVLPARFVVDRSVDTFSYVIPSGKRAISVLTTEEQGAGGMIVPGDHIDIIATYDPTLSGGLVATTIFQNVLVLAVAQSFFGQTAQVTPVIGPQTTAAQVTPTGTPQTPTSTTPVSVPIQPKQQMHPDAHTITLALTPEESQQLVLAEQNGKLRYILRSVDDAAVGDVAETVLTPTIRTFPGAGSPLTPGPLSQKTGQSPLKILDVKISPTNLHPGDVLKVEVTVKNISDQTIKTQGPDPEYTYVQGQTYYSQNFPSIPDKFRIGLNFDGHPSAPFPYRWGLGGDLGPGASTTVVGLVKMTYDVKSSTFWAALIEEPANVVQDSQGATLVTVLPSGVAVVSVQAAHVRSGPDLGSAVLTTLDYGTQLAILGQSNDWFKVKLADGREGYVAAGWIVTVNGPQAAETATAGATPAATKTLFIVPTPSRGIGTRS